MKFETSAELFGFLADYGTEMANFARIRPKECAFDWRDVPTTAEDFLALSGAEIAWWFNAAMEYKA